MGCICNGAGTCTYCRMVAAERERERRAEMTPEQRIAELEAEVARLQDACEMKTRLIDKIREDRQASESQAAVLRAALEEVEWVVDDSGLPETGPTRRTIRAALSTDAGRIGAEALRVAEALDRNTRGKCPPDEVQQALDAYRAAKAEGAR